MSTSNAHEDRRLWSEKAAYWDLHIGDEGDRNRRRHVDPAIWRLLGDVAGLRVLDAGCGTGYLSAKLAQRGARVHAVDFDEPVLQPPYPPDLPPDELQRALQCAWSVAFHLERPDPGSVGGEVRGARGAGGAA